MGGKPRIDWRARAERAESVALCLHDVRMLDEERAWFNPTLRERAIARLDELVRKIKRDREEG